MILYGPELDNFVVEPGMELEAFNMDLKDEIFLNHPFKILMFYLGKHPPYFSRWDGIDLCDFYFKMLDDYNRYGISFRRKDNVYDGDNCLYVIENDKWGIHCKSKYILLPRNTFDLKTLLFNNVKKIKLDNYDKESNDSGKIEKHSSENDELKTPSEWEFLEKMKRNEESKISKWEYLKRREIKKQKNKYLQVALMDPKIYNNESLFKDLMFGKLDDYNGEFESYPSLAFTNEKYDEYYKKTFKSLIEMIKRIDYLIEKGNSDYLGLLP